MQAEAGSFFKHGGTLVINGACQDGEASLAREYRRILLYVGAQGDGNGARACTFVSWILPALSFPENCNLYYENYKDHKLNYDTKCIILKYNIYNIITFKIL